MSFKHFTTREEAKEYIEKKDPRDLLGLVWRRKKGKHDKSYRVGTELAFSLLARSQNRA